MGLIKCIMSNSSCYKGTQKMKPCGVLWHSTGANNPNIRRYVQPDDDARNRDELLALIGKNRAGNDWNHTANRKGVNAFVGRLADGSVGAVQTLPWNFRPWGCGRGSKGSCNSGWVQFEICEDGLNDPVYAREVFDVGCALTAYICNLYNMNPMEEYRGVPLVTCHGEAAKRGMASSHADVLHWLPRYGFTMASIRERVCDIMTDKIEPVRASEWAREAWELAYEKGIMDGTNPQASVTREQLAVVLHRLGVF